MVSTYSPSKNLEEPGRGDYVGTWDTPVNSNMTIIDKSLGQTATVALTNSPVTLSAAQYQCAFITFTGTLTANVAITFPAVGSFYMVQNRTVGTFTVTLQTTVAGGEAIGAPPYEPFEIFTDATNVRFRNLGLIGSYWDYTGSSSPLWLSACTLPPYLLCNGNSFSSASYPALATILGGTNLPDSRGRTRYSLNQATGRLTTAYGIDGDTNLVGGGSQNITFLRNYLPNITLTSSGILTIGGGTNDPAAPRSVATTTPLAAGSALAVYGANTFSNFDPLSVGVAFNGGVAQGLTPTVSPGYIGGLTFIRAA